MNRLMSAQSLGQRVKCSEQKRNINSSERVDFSKVFESLQILLKIKVFYVSQSCFENFLKRFFWKCGSTVGIRNAGRTEGIVLRSESLIVVWKFADLARLRLPNIIFILFAAHKGRIVFKKPQIPNLKTITVDNVFEVL